MGLTVSVRSIYFNDPSLNPTEVSPQFLFQTYLKILEEKHWTNRASQRAFKYLVPLISKKGSMNGRPTQTEMFFSKEVLLLKFIWKREAFGRKKENIWIRFH